MNLSFGIVVMCRKTAHLAVFASNGVSGLIIGRIFIADLEFGMLPCGTVWFILPCYKSHCHCEPSRRTVWQSVPPSPEGAVFLLSSFIPSYYAPDGASTLRVVRLPARRLLSLHPRSGCFQ
jgi:hypothetical protein